MEPEGSSLHSQAHTTCPVDVPACCMMPPLETLPPGNPNGGVIYLWIPLSPEEASQICVS